MEALYKSLLELLSLVITPDWGALIALLPVALGGLVLLWFAWTIRRFASAGPTRRGPARRSPVAPPDLHMPGPSIAPIVVAGGTAALFWGLVVGGNALPVGGALLVLALLYWGREAIREHDHLVPRGGAETLPAVVHAGPPPGVHMPGPSFRPFVGAVGTTALMAGLVVGGWVLAAGVIILVATLVGWLVDARAEYVKTEEADRTGHLENIPAPGWPRGLLQGAAVIFTLAVLVQTGIIPPQSGDAAGGPDGSPAPTDGAPPGTAFTIVARDIAYNQHALAVPAGAAFTIEFKNQDASGIVHDIDIRAADGKTVVKDQAVVDGGASAAYAYDALAAGEYVFICSIHPIPMMTGTLSVK